MLLIAQAAGGKDDKKLGEIGLSDLAFSAKPRIEGLYGGAFLSIVSVKTKRLETNLSTHAVPSFRGQRAFPANL